MTISGFGFSVSLSTPNLQPRERPPFSLRFEADSDQTTQKSISIRRFKHSMLSITKNLFQKTPNPFVSSGSHRVLCLRRYTVGKLQSGKQQLLPQLTENKKASEIPSFSSQPSPVPSHPEILSFSSEPAHAQTQPEESALDREEESRPPGIKAMKKLRKKGKEKAAPPAEVNKILEAKQKTAPTDVPS
ncbi:predicted protein [Arabidopsis lyrata subsp. lyrata]|uniref:Predicted protein n=1 Tax=Arabidopsis lyrata subsp. lyrata TaxID=81972 RepID=D7LPC0_ARALL|nr:predicted protein [Arabidopsis lyrata subsp. lyrata]